MQACRGGCRLPGYEGNPHLNVRINFLYCLGRKQLSKNGYVNPL